jgi:hypothetical protein
MLDKTKLAKLLRALAQIVESSTDDELDSFARSSMSALVAAGESPKKTKKQRVEPTTLGPVDISEIVESIRCLSSREAGVSLLEHRELNKRSLEQLARHLDVPVLREDNSKRLIQKIVEATVGPRLNSEAIRGEAGMR